LDHRVTPGAALSEPTGLAGWQADESVQRLEVPSMNGEQNCLCSFGYCHYWDYCESCDQYDHWISCPIHCPEDHEEYQ
jgi:hypothetical protein